MEVSNRSWLSEAVRKIEADFHRSSDTHLIRVDLPRFPGITLYLKDESVHPTGSLKHRLARSLILHALCSGRITSTTCLVEASSGSTAVSEAYFARLLGLRFIAVVPTTTASAKLDAIRFHGGEIHPVSNPCAVYDAAENLARETGGLYLDQFANAERVTDWRGNNTIAESIFNQLACEEHPIPTWIVCGAGTGGTSATVGRYIRYRRLATKLCVADPAGSLFHRHFADRTVDTLPPGISSRIEGIGRPRIEPSFLPDVIDRMIAVDDSASVGAMLAISDRLGFDVGGSTGTNIWAALQIACEMRDAGGHGSIVTLLCDRGERYRSTYYCDQWLSSAGIEPAAERARIADLLG